MTQAAARQPGLLRQAAPYAAGAVGVAVITAAVAVIERRVAIPNLSVLYVLLVLWLGSRGGRWPAVLTSVLAFVAYDFFLVPPVGTLAVTSPSGLLELVLLLAAALVTSQLAASLESSRRAAAGSAAEARELYGLATGVLRTSELTGALELVTERAEKVVGVAAFAVVGMEGGGWRLLAGRLAQDRDLADAVRAIEDGRPVGCRLQGGVLEILASRPPRPDSLAVLPLTSGALVLRADASKVAAADLRLLAALAALAELLIERRRAAAEAERRRAVEASDSLKTAVLSSLSHELKSPLASLRAGLTALTGAGSGLPEEHRELLLGLDAQALRLDRLVEGLLTMSRLEAGAQPKLEPISFAETAGAVLRRLEPRLRERQLALDLPPDLPLVSADELQLDGVLTNLLENAVEWSSAGGRIELGARDRGDNLVAWVANEGPEIPPLQLREVFDKFWTRREGGTGLGLAICKRIVEAHGGTIEARNLRAGPEFRFTLPLAAVAEPVS
ncbi:MAG TPA: ATP-binding protein [Candidatus Dormibacteraeota bacterium]